MNIGHRTHPIDPAGHYGEEKGREDDAVAFHQDYAVKGCFAEVVPAIGRDLYHPFAAAT